MIKVLKLALLCFFVTTVSFSQNIEKLDEKNGFKDFKLGDSFQKWQSSLSYQGSKKNVKRYYYKGSCCNTIYEYPIESILLDFSNNKLVQIALLHKTVPENGSYTEIDMSKIYSKLIDSFGVFTTKDTTSDSKIFLMWFGKKVDLLFVWTYLGISEGQQYEVIVSDSEFSNKEKSDGF
jgi:hypothetical protein